MQLQLNVIYSAIAVAIILGVIFLGGGNQECCKAVGNMTFAEIDWMIVPAKYVACCNNTAVALKVYNYSDRLSRFDAGGEIIEVDANSYREVTVMAIDSGDEFAKIPVVKLDQGDIRMRLWLKIEFR